MMQEVGGSIRQSSILASYIFSISATEPEKAYRRIKKFEKTHPELENNLARLVVLLLMISIFKAGMSENDLRKKDLSRSMHQRSINSFKKTVFIYRYVISGFAWSSLQEIKPLLKEEASFLKSWLKKKDVKALLESKCFKPIRFSDKLALGIIGLAYVYRYFPTFTKYFLTHIEQSLKSQQHT